MRDIVTIGVIVSTHGVRGEVKVMPLTDFPERFLTTKEACLSNGTKVIIEAARFYKQFVLLKFKGFDSLTAVESMKGIEIQVTKQDLVPLEPGRYFVFDIVGMSVYTEQGQLLGTVKEVLSTGSNDVYAVEQSDNGQMLYIPAIKQVVKQIDTQAKRMVVELMEEF